ncbi:MAG: tail tape measure protein [Novosphingobium sp.]
MQDSDTVDTLLVDVRASTQGFARDVAAMRATFDGTLVDGLARAGGVLERGLLGAIRRGSLGFADLRRVALGVIDDIAMQAVHRLFAGAPFGTGAGTPLPDLGGLLGGVLGLPGRATGGPVAPGRPYLVGERGPELFVPTSAGRVEPDAGPARPRDVRVSIRIAAPSAAAAPQALQRSARQVAGAVRRALASD